MKSRLLPVAWLMACLLLLVSCGKEDDYYYPSVKKELVTVEAGEDGKLRTLVTNAGERLSVQRDLTNLEIAPFYALRALSNYELKASAEGKQEVIIYSLQGVPLLVPRFEGDKGYGELAAKDPVEVVSIWIGGDYLNVKLNLKVQGGVKHIFAIDGEKKLLSSGEKEVVFTLCHEANDDQPVYNRQTYLSIPLKQLVDEPNQTLRIQFKYCTRNENGEVVESNRYSGDAFDGLVYRVAGNK